MRSVDLVPYAVVGAAILIPCSRSRRRRLDRWRRAPAETPKPRLKDHFLNGLLTALLCLGLVVILFGPTWHAIAAFLILLGFITVQEARQSSVALDATSPRNARVTLYGLLSLEVVGFIVMFWPVTFLRLYGA